MLRRWSLPRTCFASSSRPLLYAAAAEDAGGQLILADRKDEALDHLNAAFDTYTRLEALADARRVGRELRRMGVERRIVSQPRAKTGWDSLTDAELKVVNVIARGATNRAAADQLHLSLHTVKTHVHNAFGKARRQFAGPIGAGDALTVSVGIPRTGPLRTGSSFSVHKVITHVHNAFADPRLSTTSTRH